MPHTCNRNRHLHNLRKKPKKPKKPKNVIYHDWSSGINHLLPGIVKLAGSSKVNICRFRGVCRSWREIIPKYKNNVLPDLDFQVDLFPIRKNTIWERHSVYLVSYPGIVQSWLIDVVHRDEDDDEVIIELHDLMKGSTIFNNEVLNLFKVSIIEVTNTLILVGHRFNQYRIRVGGDWSTNEPSALLIDNFEPLRNGLFLYGKEGRKIIDLDFPDDEGSMDVGGRDVCFFKNGPCVIDKTGKAFKIGLDFSVQLIAHPVPIPTLALGKNYLVNGESGDKLFMVNKGDESVEFRLFELNESDKVWIEINSIGNLVLVLGYYSAFFICASLLNVTQSDCVVFRRYSSVEDEVLVLVYSLVQHSLISSTEFTRLFPFPDWIDNSSYDME